MAEKSTGKTARGGKGRPFAKGQSGNPSGRPKGVPNKATQEVRELARELVEDPDYLKRLRTRLLDGTLGPGVEQMLWAYAHGKPKESVEVSGPGGKPVEMVTAVAVSIVRPGDAE